VHNFTEQITPTASKILLHQILLPVKLTGFFYKSQNVNSRLFSFSLFYSRLYISRKVFKFSALIISLKILNGFAPLQSLTSLFYSTISLAIAMH
jgi:hypothetical protein